MIAWGIAALACGVGALTSWGIAVWRIDRLGETFRSDDVLEQALLMFLIFSLFAVVFAVVWAVS